MSEEKKKRNKIIGLSIGICAALLLIVTGTYAYWQITKSQDDPNSIVAACLDITMENQSGTFGLDKAWPESDIEGLSSEGFTFTVENHCEDDVSYIIGIDSVEVDITETNGYMLDGSIKVSIDNTTPRIFGDLEDIEHVETNDIYVIRNSKKINTATVGGNSSNTHVVKAWIDYDAPVSEQNKVFGGRVFITGGQLITDDNPITKITAEECFTMDGQEIIGYDESCGTSVTIPMYVGENAVTTIDTNAFKKATASVNYYSYENGTYTEVESLDTSSSNFIMILDDMSDVNEEPSMEKFNGIIVNTTDEDVLAYINQVIEEFQSVAPDMNVYRLGEDEFPEYVPNQLRRYEKYYANGDSESIGAGHMLENNIVAITELDLSQAYNLELIEVGAFSNVPSTEYDLDNYSNYRTSLTKLTFGSNDKKIKFGHNAFANIEVDNLELYASHATDLESLEDELPMPFGNAKINNLSISATKEYKSIGLGTSAEILANGLFIVTVGVGAENFTLNEGIETIQKNIIRYATIGKLTLPKSLDYNITFRGAYDKVIDEVVLPETMEVIPDALFSGVNLNKITLPPNLKSIGSEAFRETALMEIRIPASVTEIGSTAFYDMQNDITIIFEGRSNLDDLTLGTNWNYSHNATATIQYEP